MALATSDLTTVSVNGTGVFDELMKTTKAHLDEEYKSNRIRGKEYADVYLGSLVAVLDQAVKFLQIKQQDRLVDAQIAEIEARKDLIEVQKSNAIIEGQNLVLQGQLIESQKAKTDAEIILVNAQKDKILAEVPKVAAEIAMIEQQTANLTAEALNIPKQGVLLDAQKDKILEDLKLVKQQTTNLVAEALNIPKQGSLLDSQKNKTDAEHALILKQEDKIDAEISVLSWKAKTEQAQTEDSNLGGVIGKQKELYSAQIKGFQDDSQQKLTKILSDMWSVTRTTDEATAPPFDSSILTSKINAALSNVGL